MSLIVGGAREAMEEQKIRLVIGRLKVDKAVLCAIWKVEAGTRGRESDACHVDRSLCEALGSIRSGTS